MGMFGAKRSGSTASGSGIAKLSLGIPLILLALAAWAVLLAGVSVVRHATGTDDVYGGIGFTWFVISATLFVLLLAFLYTIGMSFTFLTTAHSAIVGLLAIVTTLCILQTRDWNDARKSTPYSTKQGKGAVTAFSGFLALSVLMALLILVLGNSATPQKKKEADVYQTTQVHSNPVGAGPAVGTHAV